MSLKLCKHLGKVGGPLAAMALFASSCVAEGTQATEQSQTAPPFEADRVQAEHWKFRIVNGEEVSGAIEVSFFPGADTIWLHDVSSMGTAVREELDLVLDARDMSWRGATVSGEFQGTRVHGTYSAGKGRVQGSFSQSQLATGQRGDRLIDEPLPEAATARAAAIWLAHAVSWSEGKSFKFPWFALLGGRFEEVELSHQGVESITVPAGTFRVHRIEQRGGTPGNVLYVTTEAPYRTVRVDIVGQPMVIELEEVKALQLPSAGGG